MMSRSLVMLLTALRASRSAAFLARPGGFSVLTRSTVRKNHRSLPHSFYSHRVSKVRNAASALEIPTTEADAAFEGAFAVGRAWPRACCAITRDGLARARFTYAQASRPR